MDWLFQELKALWYWFMVAGLFFLCLMFYDMVASFIDKLFKRSDKFD